MRLAPARVLKHISACSGSMGTSMVAMRPIEFSLARDRAFWQTLFGSVPFFETVQPPSDQCYYLLFEFAGYERTLTKDGPESLKAVFSMRNNKPVITGCLTSPIYQNAWRNLLIQCSHTFKNHMWKKNMSRAYQKYRNYNAAAYVPFFSLAESSWLFGLRNLFFVGVSGVSLVTRS